MQISAPSSLETGHLRGEVLLLLRSTYSRNFTMVTWPPITNFIMARLQLIYVLFVYISAVIFAKIVRACLSYIQQVAKGASMLIDDFKVRHTNWDLRRNFRRLILVRWAQMLSWSIHAPLSSTFHCATGSGVI